jgi:hypothetical protein
MLRLNESGTWLHLAKVTSHGRPWASACRTKRIASTTEELVFLATMARS